MRELIMTTEMVQQAALLIQWAWKLPALGGTSAQLDGVRRRDVRRLIRKCSQGLTTVLDRQMNGEYLHTSPPEWTPFEECPAAPELDDDHIYINSRYQVNMRFMTSFGLRGYIHLSIKKLMKEPHIDWRDMQRIKNELCGQDREAVEIYPAEDRLVDTSNQYHLWVLPENERVPFGYEKRDVLSNEEVEQVPGGEAAVQRQFEEGR